MKATKNFLTSTLTKRRKHKLFNVNSEDYSSRVVKIYGASLSPSVCYKSMLIDSHMTAYDVVCLALRRFGLQSQPASDFRLYDVVGDYDDTGFREHYAREVATNEVVLVLQSYWQPSALHGRRFELRKRHKEEEIQNVDLRKESDCKDIASPREESLLSDCDTWSLSKEQGVDLEVICPDALFNQCRHHLHCSTLTVEKQCKPDTIERTINIPRNTPYLITIQGYDKNRDSLLYVLTSDVVVLSGSHGHSEHVTRIKLYAPDVLAMHCWLYRVDTWKRSLIMDYQVDYCHCGKKGTTYIDPISNGVATVNGRRVTAKTALYSGDLICVGKYYQFIYKDPMEGGEGLQLGDDPQAVTRSEVTDPLEWQQLRNEQYENSTSRFKLSVRQGSEKDVLTVITGNKPSKHPLTASFIIAALLEQCAVKSNQCETRRLLLHVAAVIYQTAKDEADQLSGAQKQCKKEDVYGSLEKVLLHIRQCGYWLNNCVELHNHLSKNMSLYVMAPGNSLPPYADVQLATAEDEVLGQLEDSIVHLFRQILAVLDNCIVGCMSGFLLGNPFSEDDSGPGEDNIDTLLTVYQSTLNELRSTCLHDQVISQIFSAAFHITGAHVFNAVISKECHSRFYKWSKGVQLRGNLDTVEAWAAASNLQKEALTCFSKLSALVNLLAMPKQQLIMGRWNSLRQQFLELRAGQLHHVLSNYQLGPSRQRPQHWRPCQDDAKAAIYDELQEKISTSPIFMFPETGYTFSLDKPCHNPDFIHLVKSINKKFGIQQDDYDSGMSEGTDDVCHTAVYENIVYDRSETNTIKQKIENQKENENNKTWEICLDTAPAIDNDASQSCSPLEISVRKGQKPKKDPECKGLTVDIKEKQNRFRKMSRQDNLSEDESIADGQVPVAPKRRSRTERRTASCDRHAKSDLPQILASSFSEVLPIATSSPELGPPDAPCFDEHSIPPQPTVPAPVLNSRRPRIHHRGRHTLDEEYAARVNNNNAVERTSAGHLLFNGRLSGVLRNNTMCEVFAETVSSTTGVTEERATSTVKDDVIEKTYSVTLTRSDRGLGLGLIDGLFTPLRQRGIYVRTLVLNGPAAQDGQLQVGDRILSVDGQSVLGADYHSAMDIIRNCKKNQVKLVVGRSDKTTAIQITKAAC